MFKLHHDGFTIIDLPPTTPTLLDSYNELPCDSYMGSGTRYKRFSQFRLSPSGTTDWDMSILPARAYTAPKKFNPVGGGIRRHYLPIKHDVGPFIRAGIDGLALDRSEDWQVNVHQNRTMAKPGQPGPLTPEGIHHDGHEYVMIAVLDRHDAEGAETRLWRGVDAEEPFWTGTLASGTAILLNDWAIAHDVTDLTAATDAPGTRDILIVAFSRWREKWYGDEHDATSLANSSSESRSSDAHRDEPRR